MRSIINVVEPTIHIREEVHIYDTFKIPNIFLNFSKINRFQVVPMTRKINAKTELSLVSIKWRLLVFD